MTIFSLFFIDIVSDVLLSLLITLLFQCFACYYETVVCRLKKKKKGEIIYYADIIYAIVFSLLLTFVAFAM